MRLFPLLILSASVMLTVKLGALWHGVTTADSGILAQSSALAQTGDTASAPDGGPDGGGGENTSDTALFADDQSEENLQQGLTPAEMVDEEDFGDVSNLSSGELQLLHVLGKRRVELEARGRKLEEREALLRAAEQQLIEKQESLSIIKNEIEALLAQYDTTLDAENQRLINVYSNMKPKSAAVIFNDMDMDTMMILLRGMKERKLAPIMAEMNPEKVQLISKELAQNKELPILPN